MNAKLLSGFALILLVLPASSEAVSFTLGTNYGSSNITVEGTFVAGTNSGEVDFTLNVTSPSPGFADMVAFYSHLTPVGTQTVAGLLDNLTVDPLGGSAAGFGPPNMVSNVQAGNIASGGTGKFDLGIAIGTTGAGGGDFFSSHSFTIKDADEELSVANFLNVEMAVRGQSVGPGGDSAKVKGTNPETSNASVPEGGATLLLLGLSLIGVSTFHRRRLSR
jgi:hypothetical protein